MEDNRGNGGYLHLDTQIWISGFRYRYLNLDTFGRMAMSSITCYGEKKMSDEKKHETPKSNCGDVAYAIVKAGLGSIPVAGAAAAELLGLVVAAPLERRRNQWMAEVGEALRQLEERKGFDIESLRDNDQFIDAAVEATQIAIRTSNAEKKEALRNALLNAALPNPPEETVQKMFLSFIDTLTVWHIKLLGLFDSPPRFIEKNNVRFGNTTMGSMSHLLEAAFPELRGKRDLYDLVWKDLYSRALVNTDGLHTMMTGGGIIAQRTTALGRDFIAFIRNPLEDAP